VISSRVKLKWISGIFVIYFYLYSAICTKPVPIFIITDMKKKLWLLLPFLFLVFSLHAQNGYRPGYVITNEMDTLKGEIKLKSNYLNSTSCDFKYSKSDILKTFAPADIKAYRIEDSKYYISKVIVIDSVEQKVFLEYLVKGIVSLYYLKGFQNDYYFLEKDSKMIPISNEGKTITVKKKGSMGEYEEHYFEYSNQYKHVLTYLFQDSPGTSQKIPTAQFEHKSLIGLTLDYHRAICHDNNCIDFTKSTKRSVYFEPYIGMVDSWMGLATSSTTVNQSKVFGGIQLRFKPVKRFSRWNLLVGMNYSSDDYLGVFDNTLFTDLYVKTYRIHTQYSTLRVPVTFEYSLLLEKFQPFLSVGYSNIFLINPKSDIFRVDEGYAETSLFRKYEFGVSAGFGFRWMVNEKTYLFAKNDLEYRKSLINSRYILDFQKVYSWLISAGVGIKIK
jgi:hypothetical protein